MEAHGDAATADDHVAARAAAYLCANYDSRPSDVAKAVGCSARHLQRLFARRYGCSIHACLRCRRAVVAAELAAAGTKLEAIVAYVRVTTRQSVIRYMKQCWGVTPRQYYEMRRRGVVVASRCPRDTTTPLCLMVTRRGSL